MNQKKVKQLRRFFSLVENVKSMPNASILVKKGHERKNIWRRIKAAYTYNKKYRSEFNKTRFKWFEL